MRKLLLNLMMMIGLVSFAQDPALSVTIQSGATYMRNVGSYSSTFDYTTPEMVYEVYGFNNNNNAWADAPIRCGWKNAAQVATFTTKSAVAASINKVDIQAKVMKTGANDKLNSLTLKVSDSSDFTNATVYTYDISAYPTATNSTCSFSVEITEPAPNKYYQLAFDSKKATNNGFLGLLKVDYYGQAEEGALASPTITAGENNTVVITAEEDLSIYYTVDETEPTTSSTLYTAPFTITGKTTVKAITSNGTKTSAITTAVIYPSTVDNLADFIEMKSSNEVKVNAPLTAIYQNGRNLYVKDEAGTFLLIYNNNNLETVAGQFPNNGDVLSYAKGVFKNQNGLPEMIPSEVGEKSTGTAVEPEVLTIEEITKEMLNKYVRIENVSIAAASANNNFNATDATGTIVIYNSFNNANYYDVVTVPEGEGFTVTGFVSCYNNTLQLTPVEFTEGEASEGELASPSISAGEDNTVIITAEEGLSIYYTVDETEPTTSSTLYTAPFTISGKTTVKAITSDGTKTSAVATEVIYPNTVDNLADFIEMQSTTAVKVNAPLTAIYQNGRNLYVKDEAGTFLLIYNNNNLETVAGQFPNNGDVLSYAKGTFKSQSGLPEMIPTEVGEKSTGTAVEPEVLAIEEIGTDMLNKYVRIENVSITAGSANNNYDATDDTGTIVIYNSFNNANYYDVVTVPEGEGFTVTGFVSVYNGTLQITPVEFTGGVVMEPCATPVISPESGSELNIGDEITITCATEDATIYYTLDGTTPDTESAEYTGSLLFEENVVVKAIAVKEGWLDSEVATASYTLYVEGKASAMFNFADPTTLVPTPEIPTADKTQIRLNESNGNNVFTAGSITLTFGDGTNTSNSPVLIYPTGASTMGKLEGRIYKNNTMTFTANNAEILSITFAQQTGSTNWAGFTSTPDVTEANKTFSYGDDVTEVILTSIGTSRYVNITVDYMDNSTAIDSILENNENAPVEYFNLQGMPVKGENLTPGIYVRRQGNKVGKVLVR